jgi:hypothetical protein
MRISSTEEAYLYMFVESQRTLEKLTMMASGMREDAEAGRSLDEEFPVFLTQVVYQAALATIEMGQGSPDEQLKDRLETFKWLLGHMQPKWRVAGRSASQSDHLLDSNIVIQVYIYLFCSPKRSCLLPPFSGI